MHTELRCTVNHTSDLQTCTSLEFTLYSYNPETDPAKFGGCQCLYSSHGRKLDRASDSGKPGHVEMQVHGIVESSKTIPYLSNGDSYTISILEHLVEQ